LDFDIIPGRNWSHRAADFQQTVGPCLLHTRQPFAQTPFALRLDFVGAA